MANVNVKFIHPTHGSEMVVLLEDNITGQEVITELIDAEFIDHAPEGYKLAIKGGNEINLAQSLGSAGVKEPDANNVRIIPATDAGN
jgi:ribosomal protein S6E (S10)